MKWPSHVPGLPHVGLALAPVRRACSDPRLTAANDCQDFGSLAATRRSFQCLHSPTPPSHRPRSAFRGCAGVQSRGRLLRAFLILRTDSGIVHGHA